MFATFSELPQLAQGQYSVFYKKDLVTFRYNSITVKLSKIKQSDCCYLGDQEITNRILNLRLFILKLMNNIEVFFLFVLTNNMLILSYFNFIKYTNILLYFQSKQYKFKQFYKFYHIKMRYTKVTIVLFILLSLLCKSSCSCDSDIKDSLSYLGYYARDGYQPKNFNLMSAWLSNLALFKMRDVYKSCLNKTVVDPMNIYPRSLAECPMALYQIYWLTGNYSGDIQKFKKDVQKIGKVIFSSYAACRDVLRLYTKASDECIQHIKNSTDTLNDYLDDLDMGGSGTKYLDKILLTAIQQRRLCGVNITFAIPTPIKDDSCKQASREWLYPFINQQMNQLKQKKYDNYTTKLHLMYQLAYRANSVCNNKVKSLQVEQDTQMKNVEEVRPQIEMHLRYQNIEVEKTYKKDFYLHEIEKHEES